jgi:hypothetical protein
MPLIAPPTGLSDITSGQNDERWKKHGKCCGAADPQHLPSPVARRPTMQPFRRGFDKTNNGTIFQQARLQPLQIRR